jgi:hypothetical protein
MAARNASTISSLRTRADPSSGWYRATQFLPRAFASYIAMSALRRMPSPVSEPSDVATPTLVVTVTK